VTRVYSAPMSTYPRYAIYYAPASGSDLDRFGAQLLGYDAFAGDDLPFPEGVTQAAPDWHELTADPRKYGFHATLKAPFSLAPDKTEAGLFAACSNFSATPQVGVTPISRLQCTQLICRRFRSASRSELRALDRN
jgi:hypothetical protein